MKVGYSSRDSISHRKYNFATSVSRFKRTRKFNYRGTKIGRKVIFGLGHKAGEDWGNKKDIDPDSKETKYSKNSPSFDEGVWLSKQKRKVSDKMLS